MIFNEIYLEVKIECWSDLTKITILDCFMDSYKYVKIGLLICPMEYCDILWNMPILQFSYVGSVTQGILREKQSESA
jgi:hypothetical protein